MAAGRTNGSDTFEGYYANLVSELGIDAGRAQNDLDRTDFLLNQLNLQREQVSGVSLDEESVNLIKLQTAMQAAARLISTADEMLRSLLSMAG